MKIQKWMRFFAFCAAIGFTLNAQAEHPGLTPEQKQKSREALLAKSPKPLIRAHIYTDDDPRQVADKFELSTLEEIEARNLTTSALPSYPWSDHYWPFYLGTLGWRYNDPNFPRVEDWKQNAEYVLSTDARNLTSVNQLSPSEKYDLLVGDSKRTLTQAMIQDGAAFYNASGKVETWMGLCAGWAPASYSLPRPTKAVDVIARDRKTVIRFYPSDLKALATLLWDRAPPPLNYIGRRCSEKKPDVDEGGHLIPNECFNNNPGTFHLALVNQIGVSKRGLVMDATYDYEVWNQPIYGYRYSYFNPQTRRTVAQLKDAYVAVKDFENDSFVKTRSKRAIYVAGVVLDVTYVVETDPVATLADSARYDKHVLKRYFYDLELDAAGNIQGGEWYQREHPDFLWTPKLGAKPWSVGDTYLDQQGFRSGWDARNEIPAEWAAAAQYASGYAQPLARIIETMFARSNAP